jgi:hypothetical protein
MKRKHLTALAASLAVSMGTIAAHAGQGRQPSFQSQYAASGASDTDLVRLVRYQNGSPKSKKDLSVASPAASVSDSDLVRLVHSQDGTPKAKQDLYLVRSSAVSGLDRNLVAEIRSLPGSPKSKSDQLFHARAVEITSGAANY